MKVAKQINGVVTVKDIAEFYPHTSFDSDGPSPDFVISEGIFFIDNNLAFDPATQRLSCVDPYIDGAIVRTMAVVPLTSQELAVMAEKKSGTAINQFKLTASQKLDAFAASRGYDNIISVTTYVYSTNPVYVAEANRAIYLRDQWWSILTSIMNAVLTGQRAMPTSFEELEAELPALTWDVPT